MLKQLISIASKLDKKGLYQEVAILDEIIRVASFAKSQLIRALKNDDAIVAKKALTGMSGDDLGLTHKEFIELTNAIQSAYIQKFSNPDTYHKGDEYHKNMDVARKILGVGKNIAPDPLIHSPLSRQPQSKISAEELDTIKQFINEHSINDTQLFNDLTKKYGKGIFGSAARLLKDILDIGDKEINIKNFSSNYENFIRDIVKDWNTKDFYVGPKTKRLLESAADKLK